MHAHARTAQVISKVKTLPDIKVSDRVPQPEKLIHTAAIALVKVPSPLLSIIHMEEEAVQRATEAERVGNLTQARDSLAVARKAAREALLKASRTTHRACEAAARLALLEAGHDVPLTLSAYERPPQLSSYSAFGLFAVEDRTRVRVCPGLTMRQ